MAANFDFERDEDLFPRSSPEAGDSLVSSRSSLDGLSLGGGQPSVGLAPGPRPEPPPAPDRKSARQAFLDRLSTRERFGVTLQEVGFALQGKTGPLQGMVEAERRHRLEKLAETRASVDTIGKGLSYARNLLAGPQRDAAIEAFSVAIPENMRESFKGLAKRDEVLGNYGLIDGDPRMKAAAHGLCSTVADYGKCMMEFVTDKEKTHSLAKAIDDPVLPDIEKKLSAISALPEVKAAVEKMTAEGRYPTLSDLFEHQKKLLPPELQLTRDDFLTLRRNQGVLPRFGIYTDDLLKKKAEGELKIRAKIDGPEGQVKSRRAEIQLKIDRGEKVSPREREFLDELNKADPFVRLLTERRDNQKPAGGSGPDGAPQTEDQFLVEARKRPANKGFTDAQLREYYRKNYGKKP